MQSAANFYLFIHNQLTVLKRQKLRKKRPGIAHLATQLQKTKNSFTLTKCLSAGNWYGAIWVMKLCARVKVWSRSFPANVSGLIWVMLLWDRSSSTMILRSLNASGWISWKGKHDFDDDPSKVMVVACVTRLWIFKDIFNKFVYKSNPK